MIERGTCKGPNCRAEVIFVRTEKGKVQILDGQPEKRVVLFTEVLGAPIHHKTIEGAEATLGSSYSVVSDVFTDHHATCPDADLWRKKSDA